MGGVPVWVLARRFVEWVWEDAPYRDETAAVLGLDRVCGVLRVVVKGGVGVAACTSEVVDVLRFLGFEAGLGVASGSRFSPGDVLLWVRGRGDLLSLVERVVVDVVSYASGVATRVRELVEIVERVGRGVRVAATRKTVPGFRLCSKLAFEAGGGDTHRWGLSDAVMVKDTHVELLGGFGAVFERLGGVSLYRVVVVEVGSVEEAVEAARRGARVVLLDNMSPGEVREAVERLERLGLRDRVVVEASGGIGPWNIAEYAAAGVDVVSTSYPFREPARVDFSAVAERVEGPCRGGLGLLEHFG